MSRFDLAKELKFFNRDLRARLSDLGGANTPEMRAMGNLVAKSMRKVLSVPGGGSLAAGMQGPDRGGHTSRPGEPPRAQTKRLARSVKAGVVGAERRIGPLAYYGVFHEQGVNTALPTRTRKADRHGSRRKAAKRHLLLPRRPFLDATLAPITDELAEVFVRSSADRIFPAA